MLRRFVLMFAASSMMLSRMDAAVTTVSVNGESVAETETALPVMISATLFDRADVAAPEWALAITDANGAPVSVTAVLRKKQEPTRNGPFSISTAVWTIAAEEIAKLPLGEYRLSAGESKPVRLRIVASTATEDIDKKTAKLLLSSEIAELDGRVDEAIQNADAILALSADSIAARLRKADILAGKGEHAAALQLLDEAEQLSSERFRGEHPPMLIHARRAEILAAMEAAD